MGALRRMSWAAIDRVASSMRPYDLNRIGLMLLRKARPIEEIHSYECPLCGYEGHFEEVVGATSIRLSAQCPECHSRERHRFLKIWMESVPEFGHFGEFLHFAPEPVLTAFLKERCGKYVTADIEEGRADIVLNIEDIDLPDQSLDGLMANHVLEHVDASKALSELFRVLKPGATAILTFPAVHEWYQSYEPAGITNNKERHRHFGQQDHVRWFGREIDDHIKEAGFDLNFVTTTGADSARYGLIPGDSIFSATRPKV